MYLALLGSVAIAAFTPALAQATIPAGNVLVNPGAEQQTPFGWITTAGTFQAIFYGFGDYPSRAVGDAFVGGCEFFTATGATTTAQQTIDVRGVNEIASGTVPASLSAYLGGFLTQTDDAKVDASFRDTNGAEISSF